ncbi:similar to exocyst complex component sec10 [Plenodomus lingam JN3]|uniref:Similar to exocyst complex component sec10 n=1 Tax=Leptosphaeria maculans (strain JN3 / isolate v23.1.3 / race Av1-4-5-6-7-8) TaxID=985895 RepID=E4ZVF7_LEPMJ|nr:similar to exocyst complex component sec10 [Plenodomus lingam JN3]CBX95583.1 similar to exocyst complex component sec10 [Plenodomus lingam JN3]
MQVRHRESVSTLVHATSRTSLRAPQFTLEKFSSKDFIVKDFIEDLSDAAVPASRRSGATTGQVTFDPKPLIRTFEHALTRLTYLSEDLEEKENELSGAVRRAETQHNQNVESLGRRLEQSMDRFQKLDSSLNGNDDGGSDAGGNVAMRIGERLEELDRQRKKALDAKFLIECWQEVSERGELNILEDHRRSGDIVRCAEIARQLLRISTRLNPDSNHRVNGEAQNGVKKTPMQVSKYNTNEVIEKFLENLEKDLLVKFDECYRRPNYNGMRDCAIALRGFNDGSSVIGTYVNQHSFFIERMQLTAEELSTDAETWDRLQDPDAEPPGVEPTLQSLIDEVKIVVQEESAIIRRAFPYYEEVLVKFIERIFQQSIQQRLEMVLEKASELSSLAFLRSLQASRGYITQLVDDLKSHGLTEHPEPATSQIAATLDQQLEELFSSYFIGEKYIEREKKNLEELYSSLLLKFTIYHSRRSKTPTSYFGSLAQRGKELAASARDKYMERLESTDLPASQKATLLRIAGLREDQQEKKDIEVTDEDGKLSLQVAKRMLKWLAEGVGRGLELSPNNETPKDVQILLNLLLRQMGEMYLETALEAAQDHAALQENSKTPPDLTHLPSLHTITTILHLLEQTITTILLPLCAPNLTIRRELEKTSNSTMATLESKLSNILNLTLTASLNWVSKLLSQQKKTDFRPKDDDLMVTSETQACREVSAFLSRVATQATTALSGRNLSLFLAELARGLRAQVLAHLLRFTVSQVGGLSVSKDMNRYVELVRDWPMGDELEPGAMDVLTDVSTLFIIGPEALRDRLRAASGQDAQELKLYIARRDDVNTVGVQSVLSGM